MRSLGCDELRIIALSDGVFAFAMTLLVLDIIVPAGLPLAQLPTAMLSQLPHLGPYVTSFLIISIIWDSHQRMMRRIISCSPAVVWMNLLLLLLVTFLPANASLVGDYSTAAWPVVTMATNVILLQLTALWMSWYAAKSGLMDKRVSPVLWHRTNRNNLLVACAFLLSIPVAFVSPQLARMVWLAALVGIYFLVQRSISQRLARLRGRRAELNQK